MTQGRSGNWTRRAFEIPDARLVQAEREVYSQYGVQVSVDAKAKSLLRFGKTGLMTLQNQTIWTLGGHETYVSSNLISHISSSSALDTQTIRIECHTLDGSGNFTFLVQTVTLNGQNKVALPTPVARVSSLNNSNGIDLVGRVVVYEDTPIVGGIPTDGTKIHIDIPAGKNQSFKAATTFDFETFAFLTYGFGGVGNKQTANVEFQLEVRPKGGVFQTVSALVAGSSSGSFSINLDPVATIPTNSDVRVTATSDNAGAEAFVNLNIYLAKVIG